MSSYPEGFLDGSKDFFDIDAPSGTTVIVNAPGNNITISSKLNNSESTNFLFKFFGAETIEFDRDLYASILAPLATATDSSAQDGTLVINKADDFSAEFHYRPFTGSVRSPAPVPLPMSALLLLPALAGLGFVARRKHRIA